MEEYSRDSGVPETGGGYVYDELEMIAAVLQTPWAR